MLIIDLSNFVFHRYYGIQRWLKVSGIDGKNRTPDEITTQFSRIFENYLKKYCKDLNTKTSDVYFATDCPRSEIWRNSIYSEYKATRVNSHQTFDPAIFPYTYKVLMPFLRKKYGIHVIGCDHAEADDIVAVIKRKYRADNPHAIIHIISSDRDYLQLKDNFTFLYDSSMKPLLDTLSGELCMLQKIIGGDVSDNIKPIGKNIGPKSARNLALDPKALNELLDSSEETRTRFEQNNQLINLENTPFEITEKVVALLHESRIIAKI